MADDTDTVRFTVGRIEVEPNSPNTIPSLARFTVDFRHPDEGVLTALGDQVADVAAKAAAPCTVQVTQTSRMAPDAFPEPMVALIEDAARSLDLRVIRLASGAFHDACSPPRPVHGNDLRALPGRHQPPPGGICRTGRPCRRHPGADGVPGGACQSGLIAGQSGQMRAPGLTRLRTTS